MSTKSSLALVNWNEPKEIHIYCEMLDGNYYIATENEKIKIPEKYAKKFAEVLNSEETQTFGGGIEPIIPSKINDNRMVEAKCQSCGAKVMIIANYPYNGILCSKCMRPNIYTTRKLI